MKNLREKRNKKKLSKTAKAVLLILAAYLAIALTVTLALDARQTFEP